MSRPEKKFKCGSISASLWAESKTVEGETFKFYSTNITKAYKDGDERLEALQNAHNRGLRTYGMLCPLLPGIANSTDHIDELVKSMVDRGVEEIFAEAVNPRGRGLILTQQALEAAGYHTEAAAIRNIRNRRNWSHYVIRLIKNVQQSVRKHYDINKLRFLQYSSGLKEADIAEIKKDDAGIVWL